MIWKPRGSTFKDDLRKGLLLCVRDRESSVLYAELRSELSGFTVKRDRWTSAGHPNHFAVDPANAIIPAGSQRLHRGFFGGEPRRVALVPIRFRVAIATLAGGVDAREEAVSEALDRLTDARNFGNVDACAYDNCERSYSKRSPR